MTRSHIFPNKNSVRKLPLLISLLIHHLKCDCCKWNISNKQNTSHSFFKSKVQIYFTHFLKARFQAHQICISHPVISQPSNLHQPSCHIPAIKSASDIQSSQAAVFVQSQRKNKKQCVKSSFNVQSLQRHKTDVNNVVLVSLLLTLNRSHTLFGRTCTGLNQHNTSGQ